MTHKPTDDDYKYFVHAPTLPCTLRRALLHVHSHTAGIKAFYVKLDRKKKARSDGTTAGSPLKQVRDVWKRLRVSIYVVTFSIKLHELHPLQGRTRIPLIGLFFYLSVADACLLLSPMDALSCFTRISSVCSEAELILWQTSPRHVPSLI